MKIERLFACFCENPAFDVTPREYIDLICTEVGAIPPEMAYVIIRDYLGYSLDDIHSSGKSKVSNQSIKYDYNDYIH